MAPLSRGNTAAIGEQSANRATETAIVSAVARLRRRRIQEVTHRAAGPYQMLIIGQVDYLPIAVSSGESLPVAIGALALGSFSIGSRSAAAKNSVVLA
jgi:hypothetical protein